MQVIGNKHDFNGIIGTLLVGGEIAGHIHINGRLLVAGPLSRHDSIGIHRNGSILFHIADNTSRIATKTIERINFTSPLDKSGRKSPETAGEIISIHNLHGIIIVVGNTDEFVAKPLP